MSSGPIPAPPWRGPSPTPATPGPAWRSPPPRAPYRPRWRRLAIVAALGLAALAVVTWVVFWIRPPAPARIVILHAGYDRTLAVPPNPYGKADARELATLARPGSWLGTRSRLVGGPTTTLTRTGLPDLSAVRERCVVVFVAAHGGRDRDGPFLFPEDSAGEPRDRVRFKTLLEQLARLPGSKQKLLILDATHAPAFADLGLVHNDFAAAVEEMETDIAAVPNLAVFLSSGADERSWTSPEWGTSAFAHFALAGLNGGADADGNRRVTAGELVAFVTPRVSDWARDNRGARQVPLLLPKGDGADRVRGMHLVSVDAQPATAAPEPFEPPPQLEEQWKEYRELAGATPPPTAYTPHLWRQYEAWAPRHEELILANDTDGAKIARANAAEVRRKIEAARTLNVSPQTLALQAAVGGQSYRAVPPEYKTEFADLAREPVASRAKKWAELRARYGDTEQARLLWCRALVEWVAVNPIGEDPNGVERLPRLTTAGELIPLIADGLAVRPAELNFVAMLARHLPPPDKKELIGPLLTKVLQQRLKAEQFAAGFGPNERGPVPDYSFAEFVHAWNPTVLAEVDAVRRASEDLCFATDEASWQRALATATANDEAYRQAALHMDGTRLMAVEWHRRAHTLAGMGEWTARRLVHPANDEFNRRNLWGNGYRLAAVMLQTPATRDLIATTRFGHEPELSGELREAEQALAKETATLLDATPTPRADAVKWWHAADAVLTAPPPRGADEKQRRVLVREFRRVSRQLLVIGETRPEPLPEVSAAKAREIAFQTAERRGVWLVSRFGNAEVRDLIKLRPGEDPVALFTRLDWFAYQADGRRSLAVFGSRCGELLDAVTELATKPDAYREADRWVRISPAHAAVSDAPIDRVRREQVCGYLAYQARRTFEDHWYGEGDTRYYDTAAQRLKDDAAGIVAALPPTDDPFKPYLITEPLFPVVPKLPERISVTDEPNPAVRVGFTANKADGVAGFPVFWTDPKARTPVSTTPGGAVLARSLTRPAPPQPLTPKAQTEALAVAGFFRGRSLKESAPVDFYPVPDRAAVSAPLPLTVGLAVRADLNAQKRYGFGTGAVAIVLDCSGSMGRDPKDPASVEFYAGVLEALEKLLEGLPPGTTVTVWTFGQKTFGIKAPEETIRELLEPTELPLDPKRLADVLQRARGLEPWHESPVVRAAVTAKNRVRDFKLPFKAVVLLSDAVDNRFAVDPEYGEKKRTIGDVLRAEFPPEVAVGVVAFGGGTPEPPVQGEFKLVEKLMPAGKFVKPEDVEKLIDWLRTGLNPRVRYKLEPLTSDAPPANELMAGTAEFDNWYAGKLGPGEYRLRVRGNEKFAGEIELLPGDRLLLDLTEDSGKLSLRRHWFADTVQAVQKAGERDDPWRMALLQNWAKSGRLELFTAIDANPAKIDRLSPTRIGDVWFDVSPSVPKADLVAVRWRAEGGFPAPAWSFGSPGWPLFPGTTAHAAPRLKAWWSPDPFPGVVVMSAPASGVFDLAGRKQNVTGSAVRLDAVDLEEHEVEVTPGTREKRTCLVVRLSHTAGAPVFVRPLDVMPTGREFRVYEAANKTTCLFWWSGIDAASVKSKVSGFEFVPLNNALRAAEKAGRHLTLTAPGPTETSARPEPPTK